VHSQNAALGQIGHTGAPPQHHHASPIKSNVDMSESGVSESRHSNG